MSSSDDRRLAADLSWGITIGLRGMAMGRVRRISYRHIL